MCLDTKAETKLTGLEGAAWITAIGVAHAVTRAATQFRVLEADVCFSSALRLRSLRSTAHRRRAPTLLPGTLVAANVALQGLARFRVVVGGEAVAKAKVASLD